MCLPASPPCWLGKPASVPPWLLRIETEPSPHLPVTHRAPCCVYLHLPGDPPFTHNANPHFARWGFPGSAYARQLGDSAGPRSIGAMQCHPGERRPDGNKEWPATRSACGPKSSRQHTYIICNGIYTSRKCYCGCHGHQCILK